MPHVDLSTANPADFGSRWDVCVIGAGPAGIAAATRLAQRGKRVIVLESGHSAPTTQAAALNSIEAPAAGYDGALKGRHRGSGGTSDLWGGRLIALTRHDLTARDYAGVPARPISYDDIYRHTRDVEILFDMPDRDFAQLPQGRPESSVSIGRVDGVECRLPKIVPFRNRNVYLQLAPEIARNRNITVLSNATAVDFDSAPEGNRIAPARATGFHGRSISIQADQFVFAAGTLESTRLLLLLARKANANAESTGPIGEHFVDHTAVNVGRVFRFTPNMIAYLVGHARTGGQRHATHFELLPAAQRTGGIGSAYLCLRLDMKDDDVTVVRDHLRRRLDKPNASLGATTVSGRKIAHAAARRLAHFDWLLPPSVEIHAEIRTEQLPAATSRIGLSESTDPFGVPRAKLDWQILDSDLRTADRALAIYRRMWEGHDLQSACQIEWSMPPDAPLRESDFHDVFHPSGSTRMGLSAADSVVNEQLLCHAFPNVRILSPSVFPSSGSANPMLTLLCPAYRSADQM
ncbi:GMC family oxidoreductase [Devosia sp. A8/3-2]|nr:GMC family oxidoreductase [Devosia sp. A8/3-2]